MPWEGFWPKRTICCSDTGMRGWGQATCAATGRATDRRSVGRTQSGVSCPRGTWRCGKTLGRRGGRWWRRGEDRGHVCQAGREEQVNRQRKQIMNESALEHGGTVRGPSRRLRVWARRFHVRRSALRPTPHWARSTRERPTQRRGRSFPSLAPTYSHPSRKLYVCIILGTLSYS